MERKYLVVQAPLGEEILIFSACTDHSWMAQNHKVISAGKLSIYPACPPKIPNPQISVIHGSTTLKIARDPVREEEDQRLIEFLLRPEY